MKLLKLNICYIWHEYLCGFIGKTEQVEVLANFSKLPRKWSYIFAKDVYSCSSVCAGALQLWH